MASYCSSLSTRSPYTGVPLPLLTNNSDEEEIGDLGQLHVLDKEKPLKQHHMKS